MTLQNRKPRIRSLYETTMREALMKKMGYTNIHSVPNLEKIVINMGLGKKNARKKYL